LRESDLGLNPVTQSGVIRVPLPPLTEERRRELVKVVHKLAEEGRIAVRHARHTSKEQLKKVEHVSEDDKHRADHDLQKVTDDHIKRIDELVKAKEAEIMDV
jgi:ribosome recycling factor